MWDRIFITVRQINLLPLLVIGSAMEEFYILIIVCGFYLCSANVLRDDF